MFSANIGEIIFILFHGIQIPISIVINDADEIVVKVTPYLLINIKLTNKTSCRLYQYHTI